MDINVLFTDGIMDINNIASVSLLSIKAYNTLIKLVLTRGIMFPSTYLDNNISCSSSHFLINLKIKSSVIWFDFGPALPIKGFTFSTHASLEWSEEKHRWQTDRKQDRDE